MTTQHYVEHFASEMEKLRALDDKLVAGQRFRRSAPALPGKLSEPARAVLPKSGRANASRPAQEPDLKNPNLRRVRAQGQHRSGNRNGGLATANSAATVAIVGPLLCWFGYKWRAGSLDCFSRYAVQHGSREGTAPTWPGYGQDQHRSGGADGSALRARASDGHVCSTRRWPAGANPARFCVGGRELSGPSLSIAIDRQQNGPV